MNITLIGMAGAGKSLVGREVARRLHFRFIDTDELICRRTGLSLAATLARLGDEGFIHLEAEVVLNLGDFHHCVVSPGGSVIYSRKAMDFLTSRSVVIFLKVPLEVILARVQPGRGVVRLRDRSLEELFNERLPLYEKYARHTILANREVHAVAEEIAALLKALAP